MLRIICLKCTKGIVTYPCRVGRKKFCSMSCRSSFVMKGNKYRLGKRQSEDTKKLIKSSHMGHKMSQETKEKLSFAKRGDKNYRWIVDRSSIDPEARNNPIYKEWRQKLWLRDKYKCKIPDNFCSGKIEAHHILRWSENPKIRYDINNGITLCHKHHPRKRAEEIVLSNYFRSIINTDNYGK